MRPTSIAVALVCGTTSVQAQDFARWQMDAMQRAVETSPFRWAQPRNDVIPPAELPADMTAIPTFWPRPAQFRGKVVVTITSATPFASIYYTTDGSNPTVHSAQYNGPITVARTAKVLAIAVAPDHWQSPTAIGAYEVR